MYESVIAAPGRLARIIALLTTAFLAASVALSSPAEAQLTSKEKKLVTRINAARGNHGENKLKVNHKLSQLARKHSRHMHEANNPVMHSSTGQLYSYMNQGNCAAMIGENVGRAGSVPQIHEAFMDSPPHRQNVLEGAWTKVGVGIRTFDGSLWVTELFCV
jgi:uncharacterized protein YkwD